MILASGARQLVVQEALLTISMVVLSYDFSFTPITNIGASADGAEMMTFSAPPLWWAPAFSRVVNTPVDSTTYLAPTELQGMAVGSLSLKTVMVLPSTTSFPSTAATSPLYWPWVESYLNM